MKRTLPKPIERNAPILECRKCGAIKPAGEFYEKETTGGNSTHDSYCKPCRQKISKRWHGLKKRNRIHPAGEGHKNQLELGLLSTSRVGAAYYRKDGALIHRSCDTRLVGFGGERVSGEEEYRLFCATCHETIYLSTWSLANAPKREVKRSSDDTE